MLRGSTLFAAQSDPLLPITADPGRLPHLRGDSSEAVIPRLSPGRFQPMASVSIEGVSLQSCLLHRLCDSL